MNWLRTYARANLPQKFDQVVRNFDLLEESQWWSPEMLRDHQLEKLRKSYSFARKRVPLYRRLYEGFPNEIQSWEDFAALPVLERAEAARSQAELLADRPPVGTRAIGTIYSSGTTGHIIGATPTDAADWMRLAVSIRELSWGNVEPSRTCFVLRSLFRTGDSRYEKGREGIRSRTWATGHHDQLFDSGPGYFIDVSSPSEFVADMLLDADPDYVLAVPTVLAQVAPLVAGKLHVRLIRAIAETLHDEVREVLVSAFSCPIQDAYSSQETNVMAVSCPDSLGLHTMDENVLIEVVRADGSAAEPGEEGRVLVTSLQPFVTPYIRYDLGDFAVRGGPCPCGRGLAKLERIVGRELSRMRLPDGTTMTSAGLFHGLAATPGLAGVTILQKAPEHYIVQVIGNPDPDEIRRRFKIVLGFTPTIEVEPVKEFERSPAGKYERFRWIGG